MSSGTKRLRAIIGALSIGLAAVTAIPAAAVDPPPAARPTPAEGGAGRATAAPGSARFERLRKSIWWNREPMISALALSSEQRSAMDRRLRSALESRHLARERVQETRSAFDRALVAGDLETADSAAGKLAEAVASVNRAETGFKVAVFSQLSAAQRKTLAERFPAALRRPWLVGMGRGGWARPAGRRGVEPPAP